MLQNRESRSVKSLLMKDGALEQHNIQLQEKYKKITENEVRYESYLTEDANIIMVAYGISSRIAKSAVKLARKNGIKAGLLRPKTLWPFPSDAINSIAKPDVKFLVVELNHGQMLEDVKLAVNGKTNIKFLGKAGGGLVTEQGILKKLQNEM
ncbi:hypothetical protein AGMMS49592_4130 [Endomicrobiia bacterium]|nr:hypothetical protein AGMMS49592_4130 [Endomicrobiia bacterium]